MGIENNKIEAFIEIQGVQFFDANAIIAISITSNNIRGNLQLTIPEEEYRQAFIDNELMDLITLKLSDLLAETSKVQQVKIEALQEQLLVANNKLSALENAQQMSNISIIMMLAELEERIDNDEPVINN